MNGDADVLQAKVDYRLFLFWKIWLWEPLSAGAVSIG